MAGFLEMVGGGANGLQPHRNAAPNPMPAAQPMPPSGTPSPVPGMATSSTDTTAGVRVQPAAQPGGGGGGGGAAMRPPMGNVRPGTQRPMTPDQRRMVRALKAML